jgi:outer membrane receptor for ferrienterochelin and colicins
MYKLIPIAGLALSGALAHAAGQEATSAPVTPVAPSATEAPAPATPATPAAPASGQPAVLPQVVVGANRLNENEVRRHTTAGKMVYGREELDRNGDSNIGEILKRLPGVTVGGRPGRGGGGVRMRGLGSGYTQVLVNGDRAPAGFSIESLSPDQVERIEVMRGPVAEHSAQAVAGSINIVLREGYQQKEIQLRLADSIENGMHSPSVSLTAPGKSGKLSYVFNGAMMSSRQQDEGSGEFSQVRPDGVPFRDERSASISERRNQGLHLTPRLSYRFEDGDTLTFQPFVMSNKSKSRTDSSQERVDPEAINPPYARQLGVSSSESTFMRGMGNWLHKTDDGAKLDVKFAFGGGRSESESVRENFGAAGGAPIARYVDSEESRMSGVSTGGKYTKLVGKGHLLAAGWDIEATKRTQNRIAEDDGGAQFDDSGLDLDASTRRLAAFVQDEMDITPRWSAYLGLRWEGIRTTSSASASNAAVSNISRVWSPVLHTVWRIPGKEKDQVRASLTRSYRAAPLNDMIAAPVISSDPNRSPDRTGNPNLKPELATGIDLAYEHYIGRTGIVSASGFVRNIDDLIRRQTVAYVRDDPAQTPSFLSTPLNVGKARTSGIELEAKFQLTDLVKDAPNMDVRANYSRFWSKVESIPGPDNRLDQQAEYTANFGLDYRMKGKPLTVGGSVNWTPAIVVQTSFDERVSSNVKRQLDLYGLWKFTPNAQLRISGNNLLGDNSESGRVTTRGNDIDNVFSRSRTYTSWAVRLELKL